MTEDSFSFCKPFAVFCFINQFPVQQLFWLDWNRPANLLTGAVRGLTNFTVAARGGYPHSLGLMDLTAGPGCSQATELTTGRASS